jgi:heme exporter protein C
MSTEAQTFKGVGTPATRMYGLMAIVALGWVLLGGLIFTPEDAVQGDAVRIMYVHVPTAWIAYLAFIVTGVASACWMIGRKHSLGFDRVAGASAEVGVVFMAMTLLSGSLWGRITWGTFWVWDPRLTTTAFMFVTYIGYLAVRGLGGTAQQRARRSSVIALLAVLEIPLVHFSVVMWRSLHQRATVLSPDGDIKMDGLMLFTLLFGVFGFSVLFAWLVSHRQRIMAMQDARQTSALDVAVAERLKEAQA